MSDSPTHAGRRRGIIAAAATAVLVIAGAVVTGVALFGGSTGPPEPPGSVALRQPTSSATPSSDAARSTQPTATHQQAGGNGETSKLILDRSKPVELRIPAIDVQTTNIIPLGIQPDGTIEVPERNDTVGWYKGGPSPGEFGPAVMGGHVDSDAGPAIFWSLGELRPGDKAMVRRADGKTAVFTVYAVEKHPKSDFPTKKVYVPTNNRSELRLITCGGTFNEEIQSYRSNIIVYAELTDVR